MRSVGSKTMLLVEGGRLDEVTINGNNAEIKVLKEGMTGITAVTLTGGTAYVASKFALSGMTECWRAELRKHDIRVMQINPSEVQTDFFRGRPHSERKLRAAEIAHAALSMLEMDDRGFITELSVWATNPD